MQRYLGKDTYERPLSTEAPSFARKTDPRRHEHDTETQNSVVSHRIVFTFVVMCFVCFRMAPSLPTDRFKRAASTEAKVAWPKSSNF